LSSLATIRQNYLFSDNLPRDVDTLLNLDIADVFVQLAMFGSRGFLAINLTNRGALN